MRSVRVFGALDDTSTHDAPPVPELPERSAKRESACSIPSNSFGIGQGLLGRKAEPGRAADPYHIDWDAFCSSHDTNCDRNGDPHYADDDAAMVAATLPTSMYDAGITFLCSGARVVALDKNCPDQVGVYVATESDPLVTIHIKGGHGGWDASGTSGSLDGTALRIPKNAIAQTPTDGHLGVREPNGAVCQFFQVNVDAHPPKPVTGSSLDVTDGGCASPDLTREGDFEYLNGHAGYAAQMEISRGLVRAEDIVGDRGDGTDSRYPDSFAHGVYGGFENNRAGVAWPANYGDGQCTRATSGSNAMPVEGMYFYLDRAGFEIVKRWNPPVYLRPLKRMLGTLHEHGMLDLDSSGCSTTHRYVNTLVWGPQAAYQATGSSPIDAYLVHDIAPYGARFSPTGPEGAVYTVEPGALYAFALLYFKDVPGLSAANFHWLAAGCAQLAVRGTTGKASC